MRFGNCIGYKDLNKIPVMKKIGFDYVEIPLFPVFNAADSEIQDFLGTLSDNGLKCEAVNVLFGGGIRLTGKEADFKKIEDYLSAVFEKTKAFGYDIVVFGSGGARKFEDDFTYKQAADQMITICNDILSDFAEKYNFTVAVEELNKSETNLVNTIRQAEEIAENCIGKIKVLADFYHIALEKDSLKNMVDLSQIVHCHTANPAGRFYNKPTDETSKNGEFPDFFAYLKKAGYKGRLSIEGNLTENTPESFERESRECLEFLRSFQ